VAVARSDAALLSTYSKRRINNNFGLLSKKLSIKVSLLFNNFKISVIDYFSKVIFTKLFYMRNRRQLNVLQIW